MNIFLNTGLWSHTPTITSIKPSITPIKPVLCLILMYKLITFLKCEFSLFYSKILTFYFNKILYITTEN